MSKRVVSSSCRSPWCGVLLFRSRWMPDGPFVSYAENGRNGVLGNQVTMSISVAQSSCQRLARVQRCSIWYAL